MQLGVGWQEDGNDLSLYVQMKRTCPFVLMHVTCKLESLINDLRLLCAFVRTINWSAKTRK